MSGTHTGLISKRTMRFQHHIKKTLCCQAYISPNVKLLSTVCTSCCPIIEEEMIELTNTQDSTSFLTVPEVATTICGQPSRDL